ncbi:MAG: hypothetical protein KME64_42150 [Scytonematopsis contorta HA4267-MV1]|jgi:hypothetical protein|nr:hypothetical protein [Scytonematopsis contorta HA4267-MV1]
MNVADILGNLDVDDMSTVKKASFIRDMMEYFKITDEEIEEYKNSQTNNPNLEKEQKAAAANLSPVITQINENEKQATQQLNSTENTIYHIQTTNVEDVNFNKNSDENNSDNTEESKESKGMQLANNSDIQQFVIPVVVERIITSGKQQKDTMTYESVGYTATLRLGKDSQALSLDRNSTEEENQTAFRADKDNNDQEYTIIINNLTQDEAKHFKALFEEQKNRQEQSKLQTLDDKPETELE